jgi:hypothetical protein
MRIFKRATAPGGQVFHSLIKKNFDKLILRNIYSLNRGVDPKVLVRAKPTGAGLN